MSTLMRRRLAATERQSGLSLVELMVALALLSVIGSLVTTELVGALRSNKLTENRLHDSASVRVALDDAQKLLRDAVVPDNSGLNPNAFLSASPTDVTFYSNSFTQTTTGFTGPEKVRLFLSTTAGVTSFQETVIAPSTNASGSATPYSWTGTGRTRVLATNVASVQPARSIYGACAYDSAAPGPVFVYFGPTDGTCSSLTRDATGAIAVGQLPAITQVEVWLTAQTPGSASTSRGTSDVTRVYIVNNRAANGDNT